MSVVLINRTARRPGPEMPDGEIQLQEPPALPEPQSGMANMLTMAPMALSSLAMVFLFLRPGGGDALTYVAIGMMALAAVGMLVAQLLRASGDRKRALRAERRDYLRYLSQMRRQVRKTIDAQRLALAWRHPAPEELRSLVRTSRLWERRPSHPDFSDVRIGTGPQRLAAKLAPLATKPVEDLEPLCAHALRRFIHSYGTVGGQPTLIYLRGFAHLLLRSDDAEAARAMTRALLAQLAVFHAPDDLRVAIAAAPDRRAAWEWAKWLPHALHPTETDGAGLVRLVGGSAGELEELLGQEFTGRPPYDREAMPGRDEPFTVLVLDGVAVPTSSRLARGGYRNAIVVDLGEALEWKADPGTLRLRIEDGELTMVGAGRNRKDEIVRLGVPDELTLRAAERLALRLAPYRLGDSSDTTEPLATDFDLTTLLGIGDLYTHDVQAHWEAREAKDELRVPLGITADGTPVDLDIKESAQDGMGPHGMLIGATGSGKSELLRTLVLALAITHSSETLNFVLVDFKGGATFLGLDRLPHTSAVITNLADEAALVDRMRDALHGEMVRRQELLRSAGNYSSLLEYEKARAAGTTLAPLPTLFVVVDEFSELLAAHRDFMELFIMIGRLGRSLGVHLLLASQRLDEGRMHALESHLSYRIGLRTFSAMESRGVLGVPDAYELPSQPGNGFLRSDISTLTRFKAAYVSGAYRPRRRGAPAAVVAGQVVAYGTGYVTPRRAPQKPEEVPEEESRSLLEVAAERLVDAGPPAHQVWLPPLAVPPSLDELLPPLAPDPSCGLTATTDRGTLSTPVGVVDLPFQQRRDLLVADLSGAGGHTGIAGAPQSGKSTLLRTLIAGLALTHTPEEVQFYCLDFGGGTLASLRRLPHVGGVTGRHDAERVLRTVAEINAVLSRRERYFAELGIDSVAAFRRLRAAGELPDETHGDVFLVIDGWNTLRQEFNDLVQPLTLISQRGLNYGVHLMVATTRWGEVGGGLRDQLQTRFELRLGDPVDSMINMRAAAKVPNSPGRGLTADQTHFLTALPRMDGSGATSDLSEGVADLVDAVAEAWTGRRAPEVRMLPLLLDAAELPAPRGRLEIALGVEETEIAPIWHSFEESPHLLVIGDAESGKTNLLKHITASVLRAYSAAEAKIMLVDFRRELHDVVPDDQRLGYAVAVDVLRQGVEGAARAMKNRVPPADIPLARLKLRDWWEGPELFVVVDDYDLVATGSATHPFAPLLDYLAQGTEIGLHLIVARGANNAGRALSDPLLRRMLEVNTPAVLLSCPPSEGYLFGNVKPRRLPTGRALHITRRRTTQIQTALSGKEGGRCAPLS
ncbi:type VII secretion protein EccCa [Actinoallomurus iriomotensis]|uniref:Type VII secretion protein EccC n=1 Tax=Actinoallomurus iriomotensis TaxID=478107 RepID=A0A9W6RH31_9ACTN|nr:type VII secretion protein EccCa [Actinoallomurus iriomotensis]GLY73795.1 type VII secretion protein EccC [Actinoallomurus iriomotensis]